MSKDDDQKPGEGFLEAWSRRKRAATRAEANQTEAKAEDAVSAVEAPVEAPLEAEPEDGLSAQELAALPSIDDINGDTNLQPFLKRGVPSDLRKAALRKVWLSNKLIAGHDDPAVDYAWDWNAPEGVPGAGGLLSKDGVAKMMGDLIKPRRPDPVIAEVSELDGMEDHTDPSIGPDVSPAGDQVASLSQDQPTLPGDPVRHSGQSVSQDAMHKEGPDVEDEDATADKPQSGRAHAIPVRRHGSAMPE